MVSFEPTPEQCLMRDTVSDFAKEKLRPASRHNEEARAIDDQLRRAAAELGLGALSIPEAYGGAGTGARTAVLVEEELAFGDAGASFAIPGPGPLAHALVELGSIEQCRTMFEPFVSDPHRVGAVAF